MRKSNLLAVAALGLSVFFASCNSSGQPDKRQLYNNESKVDTEAYTFFKTVHEKAAYELAYAEYAAANGAPQSLTNSIREVYGALLPELENIAAEAQIIIPDPGQLIFSADELHGDSSQAFVVADYQTRFIHEQGQLVDQFKRASRNTYKPLRAYAQDKLSEVQQLYVQAGGQEDNGAHH